MRIIYFLIVLTLISESISFILVKTHKYADRPKVYHIYAIVDIILVTIYYLKTIWPKRYKLFFFITIIVWPTIGFLNLYIQPYTKVNTNMLLIECFVVIIMSLHSLYKILINDALMNVTSYPHFWVWICFLFLWCSTFFFWAFFDELMITHPTYRNTLNYINGLTNILVYSGIGASFLLCRKVAIK